MPSNKKINFHQLMLIISYIIQVNLFLASRILLQSCVNLPCVQFTLDSQSYDDILRCLMPDMPMSSFLLVLLLINLLFAKNDLQLQAQNPSMQNYMSIQSDITPQMRGILINWLIEVRFFFTFSFSVACCCTFLYFCILSLFSLCCSSGHYNLAPFMF